MDHTASGLLRSKVAVVLGASRSGGSGWVTAQQLASEGAHVVVAARRLERLEVLAKEIGGTAMQCDAAVESEVATLMDRVAAERGQIDLAVAAVGQGAMGSIDQTSQAALDNAFAVNFFGPFHFVRHAARHMPPGASAVLFSTITAEQVLSGSVAYSCAKAALNAFVKYAAVEYAPRGIRVNSLQLGLIEGPQARRWREAGMFERFLREIPLGAPVDPIEIARTILWLATDAVSVTGAGIRLDGGNHLRRQIFPDEMSSDGLLPMHGTRSHN